MVLVDKDILKLQELYKTEFGIEISKEVAYGKGIQLLTLLSKMYKTITLSEIEIFQKQLLNKLILKNKKNI